VTSVPLCGGAAAYWACALPHLSGSRRAIPAAAHQHAYVLHMHVIEKYQHPCGSAEPKVWGYGEAEEPV
jgi:hypothetical protein